MSNWHKYAVSDIALDFGTDVKNGKSNVRRDRKRRGDNTVFLLPTVDSKSEIKKLVSDASVILLAIVYILSAFLGRVTESLVGLAYLFTVFCISFAIKHASSKRVANSYRLLLPKAKIIENGMKISLSAFDVEVGDLIEFSQGDIIPADARIVYAENLTVAERYVEPLTGKVSYRKEGKVSDVIYKDEEVLETYSNMIYAASIIISGKGRAIVTETGSDTKFTGQRSEVKIISENDSPDYFSDFYSKSKRMSLIAFTAIIPLTFLSLLRHSPISPDGGRFDLLYSFLLLLASSVTCMSELVISPAEFLVTKELLISSRTKKKKINSESRITKLSSSELIADTDTVLILTKEALIDTGNYVRRIFFADKNYRFDSLKSDDLSAFYDLISPIVRYSSKENLSQDMLALKSFLSNNHLVDFESTAISTKPKFLKNFPIAGSRACVFDFEDGGKPINCIFYLSDLSLLGKCTDFRTEGGGVWKTEQDIIERIHSEYNVFKNVGLSPVLFFTYNRDQLIFEGMIGVGREYPFTDGTLFEDFSISGIQSIIFLDKENQDNLIIIKECGLVPAERDIAFASEYKRNGMDITDAPITTKAYIGFDRKEISKITDRLIRNGRKILPIIKDSADRRYITPVTVYAVHSVESHDSVKISTSLSLQPASSDTFKGGIGDVLTMIRGACKARLKLGVFKNYLAFSVFFRAVSVCCSLLFGKSGTYITSLMILSMGFVCDAIAVSSFIRSKGTQFKPKEVSTDTKVMFSPTLLLFFSMAGVISGLALFAMTETILNIGKLSIQAASVFLYYSAIFAQLTSLGGFLAILNNRSRKSDFNWLYWTFVILAIVYLVLQNYISDNLYNYLSVFNFTRIDLHLLPYIFVISIFTFIIVFLISKLLTLFSKTNIK